MCAWNIIETVFLQEQAMNIIAAYKTLPKSIWYQSRNQCRDFRRE